MKFIHVFSLILLYFLAACSGKPKTETVATKKPIDTVKTAITDTLLITERDTAAENRVRQPSTSIKNHFLSNGVIKGMEVKKVDISIPSGGTYRISVIGENEGVRIKPPFPLAEYVNRKSWEGYIKQDIYPFEVYLDKDAGLSNKTVSFELHLTRIMK